MSEKAKIGITAGVIVVLFILAVMTPFSIFWIELNREMDGEDLNKIVKKYESEWKIEIKDDINVEYNYVTDKVKYSYAKCVNEPKAIISVMNKTHDSAFEAKLKGDVENISEEIAVKSVIDFEKEYYYLEKSKDNMRFYALYFPSINSVYLYEIKG